MDKQYFKIAGIPAILWGPSSDRLFIAVHGDQSNKDDAVFAILAGEAMKKGYQTISFDLPEHGDRQSKSRLCKVQNCIEDLDAIMKYAHETSENISLFGCSMGAYFSMLAYKDEPIRQALFLSPIVDMKRVINNMMAGFNISEDRLRQEEEIETPVKTLYWDYYQYVLEHPVAWDKPAAILYGEEDKICELDYVSNFAERFHADLTVLENSGHYFYTDTQLEFFRQWLSSKIV